MSQLQKKRIICLPTNKAENALILNTQLGKMWKTLCSFMTQSYLSSINCTSHHLYVISDEEIKEGESCWGINKNRDTLYFLENSIKGTYLYWDKVIASSDKSLKVEIDCPDNIPGCLVYHTRLVPNLKDSFIQKWIEQYNKGNLIKWVNVEYETERYSVNNTVDGLRYVLKLRSDNTITTHRIKDSWTKEEVKKILYRCYLEGYSNGKLEFNDILPYYNKFIERNL